MGIIAFYGGSFNPPTKAHEAIVNHLIEQGVFQNIIIKPCGYRSDKPELAPSKARVDAIVQQLSRPSPSYQLDLSAIHKPMIPTVEEWQSLKATYPEHDIYFVCGTDLFALEQDGRCQIRKWVQGDYLFEHAHFYIYPRPGSSEIEWPPHHNKVKNFTPIDISSSEMRAKGWKPA